MTQILLSKYFHRHLQKFQRIPSNNLPSKSFNQNVRRPSKPKFHSNPSKMKLINTTLFLMSVIGASLIVAGLFSNDWIEGNIPAPKSIKAIVNAIDGNILHKTTGLFLFCHVPSASNKYYESECIPDWHDIEMIFHHQSDDLYPIGWTVSICFFIIGLTFNVISALASLTCSRSILTVCSVLICIATVCYGLGLLAFVYGWGSNIVNSGYCSGQSSFFSLGEICSLGKGFWLAVAGTICSKLAFGFALAKRSKKDF